MQGDLCVYLGFVNISSCLPSSVLPLLLPRSGAALFQLGLCLRYTSLHVCLSQWSAYFFFTADLFIFVPYLYQCGCTEGLSFACAFELTSRKTDFGATTWGLDNLIFPYGYGTLQAVWWVFSRAPKHRYSHWCLRHEVRSVVLHEYHTYIDSVSSVSALHVWMNECKCLCASLSMHTPLVSLFSVRGTEAPGGRLIYSCVPREDCTSSSSFGMV